MHRNLLKFRLTILAGMLAAVGILAFLALNQPAPETPALPNPNGYDDLVEAGKMLVGDWRDYMNGSVEELKQFVEANRPALERARVGLQRECRVPPYGLPVAPHMASIRGLNEALRAEARLAELNGATSAAAQIYLDIIRVSHEISRGGVMLDSLSGLSYARHIYENFDSLLADLTAHDCRELIAELEHIDGRKEVAKVVLDRESRWSKQHIPLSDRVTIMMQEKSFRPHYKDFKRLMADRDQSTAMLLLNLAAHAYELEQGKPLKDVAELVPNYLRTVPRCPLTGTNLVYLPPRPKSPGAQNHR